MSTGVWHELGAVDGVCTICSAEGSLTLGEARFPGSLIERMRRRQAERPARFVTCCACGWRWSVRAGDTTAAGLRHRSVPSGPSVPYGPSVPSSPSGPSGSSPARSAAPDPAERPIQPPVGQMAPTRTVLPASRDGRGHSRERADGRF